MTTKKKQHFHPQLAAEMHQHHTMDSFFFIVCRRLIFLANNRRSVMRAAECVVYIWGCVWPVAWKNTLCMCVVECGVSDTLQSLTWRWAETLSNSKQDLAMYKRQNMRFCGCETQLRFVLMCKENKDGGLHALSTEQRNGCGYRGGKHNIKSAPHSPVEQQCTQLILYVLQMQ